jgi:tetratricopeptide (TPR) repeat protein
MGREELFHLEERLRNNPGSLLFARLADHYCQLGRIEEAIQLCQQGLQRHPRYATGYVVLAKAYWRKGQLDAARSALDKSLELEPHNLQALSLRAQILRASGSLSEAAQDYRDVLALNPLDEGARLELESLESLEETLVGPAETSIRTSRTQPVQQLDELTEVPSESLGAASDEEVEKVLDEIFDTGLETVETEFEPELEVEEEQELVPPSSLEESSPEEEELKEILGLEEDQSQPPRETVEQREEPARPEESSTQPGPSGQRRRPTLVTPTLGEIYAAQGQYAKAIGVFQVLKERDPDNPEWDRKIEMLKRKLMESEGDQGGTDRIWDG